MDGRRSGRQGDAEDADPLAASVVQEWRADIRDVNRGGLDALTETSRDLRVLLMIPLPEVRIRVRDR